MGDKLVALGKNNQIFETIAQSTENGVRDALMSLRSDLADLGVQDEVLGTVELAVAEALNNIVEHAFVNRASGEIRIAAQLVDGQLHMALRDEGRAFPEHALPPGLLPSCDVGFEDLPEGGFGWFLIRQLTEDLRYQRQDGQNCLDLVFAVS